MRRRRLRRRQLKKQRKIIIVSSIVLLLGLSVGYSAFSTQISLNAKGNIKEKPHVTVGGIDITIVTSGDGLYEDYTEEGRYVYKGALPDNYITLGSDTYRIISVESDGTLKVIRNSSIGLKEWDIFNARYSTTSTDYCISEFGCKAWGSSTTTLDSSENNTTQMPWTVGGTLKDLPSTEASLNTYLNGEWYNALDSNVQNIIVSHIFNIGPTAYDQTDLSASVIEEATYKWKGKVGLMNATDYVKTSTNSACTSVSAYYSTSSCYDNSATHNWLFTGNDYWTVSPSSGSDASYVFAVTSAGGSLVKAYTINLFNIYGVAPVLYLSSDISLSGSGTSSDPYIVG